MEQLEEASDFSSRGKFSQTVISSSIHHLLSFFQKNKTGKIRAEELQTLKIPEKNASEDLTRVSVSPDTGVRVT